MARILIVDDEESVRKPLRILLERRNYTIVEASDGVEALDCIRDQPVDLVISDVVMPRKGGIEMTMDIHNQFPTIPMVLMTGKMPTDNDSVRNLMQRFGASRMLRKPFSKADFLSAVSQALG